MDSIAVASMFIAATFSAEPLLEFLSFWAELFQFSLKVEFAPLAQIFQPLLGSHSEAVGIAGGVRLTLIRMQDWAHDMAKLEQTVHEFIGVIRQTAGKKSTLHLICICPISPQTVAHDSRAILIGQAEELLIGGLAGAPNTKLFLGSDIAEQYAVKNPSDETSDTLGSIPYTSEFYAAVATAAFREVVALSQPSLKVIVSDCDNTLWTGIVAEDGIDGLRISNKNRELSEILSAQKRKGVLLCLCSKNELSDIVKVFECRPDIILRWNDFVSTRINWLQKSENLRSLATELNVGLDSFLFVDDNPVECAEVSANCPEVRTLQIPKSSGLGSFFSHYWLFDMPGPTKEGERRTQFYLEDRARRAQIHSSQTLKEYIEGLQLKLDISSLESSHIPRAIELMYRTNQFNTTGFKRPPHELRSLLESHELDGRAFRAVDRFGDYGLVGLVLFSQSMADLVVKEMLLSCRALGRGIEYWMAGECGRIAIDRRVSNVIFEFIPSARNKPAYDFLERAIGNAEATSVRTTYKISARSAAELEPRYDKLDLSTKREEGSATTIGPVGAAYSSFTAQSMLFAHIALSYQTASAIVQAARQKSSSGITAPIICRAPETPVERAVAKIWSELLGFAVSDSDSDFFDLGGDSLKAVRVLSQVQEKFQVALPLVVFFEEKTTVATLCSAINDALRERNEVE
jgi:FkbH-like protein